MALQNVTVLDSCVGCGMCAEECRLRVFKMEDGKAVVQDGPCMKCGHCFSICPTGSIQLMGIKAGDIEKPETPIQNTIMNRHSIRCFKQETIPKEEFEKIMQIAKYAPSACNDRPVQFTVVNLLAHPEIEARIIEKHEEIFGAPYTSKNGEPFFRTAPYMLVAHADPAAATHYPFEEDGIIFLTTAELHAKELGFGTFWCGLYHIVLKRAEERAAIGIPGTHKVLGVLGIGKPNIEYERPAAREPVKITWVE